MHLQNVTLGRNLDTEVQVVAGLKATDRVVANPSLGLLEGQQVKVVQPVPGYQPSQSAKPEPPPMGTNTAERSEPPETQPAASSSSADSASPGAGTRR